ncbi:hypothetical protein [Falsiroseomonas bella]|uniref:hypothetical protein n=1 Tax=Falsiroseomonas bella TaxID=2184016 RepID=UPI0011B6E351|nr:hypothetical protein [Falsiroseomonas bella]
MLLRAQGVGRVVKRHSHDFEDVRFSIEGNAASIVAKAEGRLSDLSLGGNQQVEICFSLEDLRELVKVASLHAELRDEIILAMARGIEGKV